MRSIVDKKNEKARKGNKQRPKKKTLNAMQEKRNGVNINNTISYHQTKLKKNSRREKLLHFRAPVAMRRDAAIGNF